MMKKIMALCFTAVGAVGMIGCDSGDAVAVGAGVVGGAIIAGALDNNGHHHHRRGCYDRYDGYRYCRNNDGWRRGGRHDGHHGRHRHWAGDINTNVLASLTSSSKASQSVAAKYSMAPHAAEYVVNVLDKIKRDGRLDHGLNLGLTQADMKNLAAGQLPAQASLNGLAQNLQTSVASVTALMNDVAAEISIQREVRQ